MARAMFLGVTHSRKLSDISSSRVMTPVMAELLKSIQYGNERWMEQKTRNTLVKKYEEGIIDSAEYEKLTLDHFQVFWPGGKPIWINYRRNFKGQFPPEVIIDQFNQHIIVQYVVCTQYSLLAG
ncbi:hypothetical protein OS493_024830 [Desmophyllum pertusum]|uniref:Uncharacterized protein n=1 Tax=Desmophyllum pertusum TaxID=174260 RepID=A0A9X0CWJ4_9CNID|nr:hypothetical protein OS493_024830 [Desmophyllum pertusum]